MIFTNKLELQGNHTFVTGSWSDFKTLLNGVSASLGYVWEEKNNYYNIATEPLYGFSHVYPLNHDNISDKTDFDTNFKNQPYKKEDSHSILTTISQSTKETGAISTVLSSANASTVAFQLLPSNENRKIVMFYTDGNKTFYLGLGATPTITLFTIKLAPGTFFTAPDRFIGSVSVISNQNDASSKIMITEVSY